MDEDQEDNNVKDVIASENMVSPLPAEDDTQKDESLNAVLTQEAESYKVLNYAFLFVMSGLHEGATYKISQETSIGNSFENDLILTDDVIEPTHVLIRPVESRLGFGIEVTCKGDTLLIDGEKHLNRDDSVLLKDTFVITIGTVSISIRVHSAGTLTTAYKKYLRPRIQVAQEIKAKTIAKLSLKNMMSDKRNIIIMVMGGVIMMTMIYGITVLFEEPKKALKAETAHMAFKELTIKKISEEAKYREQALIDLKNVLKQYDLDKRVTAVQNDNTLYIKGTINGYEDVQWAKVQNWYDTTYGSKVDLVSLITVDAGARRTISFKAVVTEGQMPFVVAWTGDRYKVGSTLPGGWIILNITDKGVVVKDAIDDRVFLVEHIQSRAGL